MRFVVVVECYVCFWKIPPHVKESIFSRSLIVHFWSVTDRLNWYNAKFALSHCLTDLYHYFLNLFYWKKKSFFFTQPPSKGVTKKTKKNWKLGVEPKLQCSNLYQNPLCDFEFIRVLQLTWCHMFIQAVVQGSSKGTLSSSNFSKYCVYVFLTRPIQYTTYAANPALRAVTRQCIRRGNPTHVILRIEGVYQGHALIFAKYFSNLTRTWFYYIYHNVS